MPFATVCERTVVLLKTGWEKVANLNSHSEIIGFDRHGQPSPAMVRTEQLEVMALPTYLGTPSTFGVFSPWTKVLNFDGVVYSSSQLVEEYSISEIWFETSVAFPKKCVKIQSVSIEQIWNSLQEASVFAGSQRLALQCRTHEDEYIRPFARHHGFMTMKCGKQRFLILFKERFTKAIKENWAETLLSVAELWLSRKWRNIKEELLDKEHSSFCMWYISALRHLEYGFYLSYDSIQSTDFCHVLDTPEPPSSMEQGSCSCYGYKEEAVYRVHWKNTGWNPLMSGFLIAPS